VLVEKRETPSSHAAAVAELQKHTRRRHGSKTEEAATATPPNQQQRQQQPNTAVRGWLAETDSDDGELVDRGWVGGQE